MVHGECHCGAVKWDFQGVPGHLTSCNCSICRRINGLWAHGTLRNVTVRAAPGATQAYVQGDRTLAFHTCLTCGCTTHWLSLAPDGADRRIAVNARMSDPAGIAGIRVRHFDGADTWTFLD